MFVRGPVAGRLVEVEELVMPPGGTHTHPKPLVPTNRLVGQNDVGMIAWTLTLKTPECPQGRKVYCTQSTNPTSIQ